MYESMANFRSIFGRNPIRSIAKEYYKWKLSDNPYQRGHIYLERKDGIVVGSTTITPKRIAIFGEELLGAEIGDTFTHHDYRRQGIFSRGVTECTEYAISRGIDIIYGAPNSQSLPGYQKKLGYALCPFVKVKIMYKFMHVLAIEEAVSRRLGRHYLSKLFARIYFQYLSFRSRVQESLVQEQEKGFDILPIDRFTMEFEGLWGSPRKDHVFFTVRDKTYLNWRFSTNPDNYMVLLATKGDDYFGCVVTKLSKRREVVVGTICDFVTHQDRLDVFYQLIREAEKRLKEAGAHYLQVRCAENSPYFQALVLSGYIVRGAISGVIIFAGTEVGKQILETNRKWHFTIADSDNI